MSTYEDARDEYLAHVESCTACERNKWGHRGWTLEYWTILHPCSTAVNLLTKMSMMFLLAIGMIGCHKEVVQAHPILNLELNPKCIKKAVMVNCKFDSEPPVCERARVTWDKGCGVVEVEK